MSKRYQLPAIVLLMAGLLMALLAVTPRAAAAENPPPTPGKVERGPSATSTAVKAFADIGPVYPWRWRSKSLSNMCLENHSSFPMQVHTGEWNKAYDLNLKYEGCGPATADPSAAYPYWARIDVYDGYNPDKSCSYSYFVKDSNGVNVYRYIIYLNKALPLCWSGTVRKNHYTSEAIGMALGLAWFDTYPPNYVSVMRATSYDTVSYAQPGDRATFDYYNDCGCHV